MELKEQYSDILLNGGDIFDSEALPEEADEPIISHLPRLVIDFNRREYGRLRQFIDSINAVELEQCPCGALTVRSRM